MFGSSPSGANAYAKVGIETGVSSASPHKLIVMLFEGALIAVTTAAQQMKAGNIAGKAQSISKAMRIIDHGLRASLNKDAGGEIGQNLDALYEYMSNRLMLANLKNDPEMLDEVYRLLRDLKEAWDAIGNTANQAVQTATPATPEPAPATRAYDALEPNNQRLVKA